MRCLIGVKNESTTTSEEGGMFFYVDEFGGNSIDALIAEVTRIIQLPEEHRPPTFPYENAAMLGVIAASDGIETAFELGFTEDGVPMVRVIQVVQDVPPEMLSNLIDMLDDIEENPSV